MAVYAPLVYLVEGVGGVVGVVGLAVGVTTAVFAQPVISTAKSAIVSVVPKVLWRIFMLAF